MRKNLFLLSALFSVGLVGNAKADPFIDPYFKVQTGVQDTSNLWYGAATTGYGFSCTTAAGDPTTYINSISVVPGTGWDSNVTFDVSSVLRNGFANNDYTLGTPLGDDRTYYWSNVVSHSGAFDSSIATGIYDFTVLFQGGADSTASDTLFTGDFQVEIVNKVDVTVTSSVANATIGWGETATVSTTLTNNGSRDFVSSTWFVSGFNIGSEGLALNFVGDWFDKTVAPGDSRTDLHSTWTASATQTPGAYVGSAGVVGGYRNGDQFLFGQPDNTTIQVVPEPGSILALTAGLVLLVRSRRRS